MHACDPACPISLSSQSMRKRKLCKLKKWQSCEERQSFSPCFQTFQIWNSMVFFFLSPSSFLRFDRFFSVWMDGNYYPFSNSDGNTHSTVAEGKRDRQARSNTTYNISDLWPMSRITLGRRESLVFIFFTASGNLRSTAVGFK